MPAQKFDAKIISAACVRAVEYALKQLSSLSFTSEPAFVQREIIEYDSRMRVFGMEIFNGPCYISTVNYYFSETDAKGHNACGAFVLYLEESAAARLFKSLGFKNYNEDDDVKMMATAGELCQTLAEAFKKELSGLGYQDLIIGQPLNYHNFVPDGVEFSYDQYVKCETSFTLWRQKVLVVDVTLKPL